MTENSNQVVKKTQIGLLAEKWARAIFFGLFLVLPLAITPFRNFPAEFTKHFIFVVGIFVVLFLCLVTFYCRERWKKPRNLISYALVLVGSMTLLATLFSENIYLSFFGLGSEKDTFITIWTLILAAFIPSFIYRDKDDLPKFGFGLAVVASSLVLLEVIFLAIINLFDFVFLTRFVGLVSASWYEEATFLGLVVILVLTLFEFFSKKASWQFRLFLLLSLIASLLFLGLINYWVVWLMLAIFSLLIVALIIRRGGWAEIINIPTLVLLVSLLFVVWGGTNSWLGRGVAHIQTAAKINILEVRPNWTGTYQVSTASLKQDFVFGLGPARFWHAWGLYKPDGVNLTPFWNTDFSYGIGFIPSLFVGHGLAGGVAWIVLLSVIIFSAFVGLKRYWLKPDEKNSLLVLAIMPVLYLWPLLVFRSPDLCVLALAFVFLGWLMVLQKENGIMDSEWVFGKSKQSQIIFSRLSWPVFILVLVLIAYSIVSFLSFFALQRGWNFSTKGNLEKASVWMTAATRMNRSDFFERQVTAVKLAQINQLIKTGTGTPEQIQSNFLNLFNSALRHADTAIKIDSSNYANYLNLAHVYGLAVPLGISGAEDKTLAAYQKALHHNPNNPGIWYELAQLSIVDKKTDQAKDYLNKAIALKPNYLEARFALAQLDVNDGLINKAIVDATEMTKLLPGDYNAWFLLGYLKYQKGEIESAAESLAKSLQLEPNYGDAKYLIGLSLDRMGRRQEALEVFKELIKANPDNKALKQIVSNLSSGQPAFGQPASSKTVDKIKK